MPRSVQGWLLERTPQGSSPGRVHRSLRVAQGSSLFRNVRPLRLAPDAAIATGLLPVLANVPGRLIALAFPAALLAEAVVLAGRDKLENAGWIVAAVFG